VTLIFVVQILTKFSSIYHMNIAAIFQVLVMHIMSGRMKFR